MDGSMPKGRELSGKEPIVTSSNQSVSAERGALKVFGVLFIVLGVVYLISGGVTQKGNIRAVCGEHGRRCSPY